MATRDPSMKRSESLNIQHAIFLETPYGLDASIAVCDVDLTDSPTRNQKHTVQKIARLCTRLWSSHKIHVQRLLATTVYLNKENAHGKV